MEGKETKPKQQQQKIFVTNFRNCRLKALLIIDLFASKTGICDPGNSAHSTIIKGLRMAME